MDGTKKNKEKELGNYFSTPHPSFLFGSIILESEAVDVDDEGFYL